MCREDLSWNSEIERRLKVMIQDQGKIKLLQTIGKRVTLTGQMLYTENGRWEVEIVHKNGMKEWVDDSDLTDIE